MIRESLVPSDDAAGSTAFSASAFFGAFVFFTAGASNFAEAVAAFLLGAIAELATGRAGAVLFCSMTENAWTLLVQDSSIISNHLWTAQGKKGALMKGPNGRSTAQQMQKTCQEILQHLQCG